MKTVKSSKYGQTLRNFTSMPLNISPKLSTLYIAKAAVIPETNSQVQYANSTFVMIYPMPPLSITIASVPFIAMFCRKLNYVAIMIISTARTRSPARMFLLAGM